MGNMMDKEPKKIKAPKKTPRIKHKKLIILFTAILVVATVFIIKMFSTKHYALAEETESFEIERPTTGNPLDYSAKDNAAICNWVIKHTTEFKSVTTGTVKAKVAVINYNQELKNTRIVTNDGCYIETISDSSLVHVYEEKYIENDQVVVRKNHSNKYNTITNEVFLEKYGWHPKDFQAYILNEDTIVEATIEEFEGNYKLKLILDPVNSSPRKQRETKTIGNAKGYPGYKTTELTIILTSDWTPIEVDTYEVYDIGMPGIGDVTCKCNMVELFEYGKFEIPDKELFKEHISDTPTNIEDNEKDVIGYLQEIFGPLIQGQMNDFEITVDALDTKLNGNLNINLGVDGVSVKADIDDIFVNYKGDDVFVKLGANKYKVNIKNFQKYLGSLPSTSTSQFDVNAIIDQVQNAEIINNGNSITIKINLDIMGIKASANIIADVVNDTYAFNNIYAKVDAFGKIIILTMKPSETAYNYPVIDGSYSDITNIGFVIDEVKNLINKPVEITLNTNINDIIINASAVYNNGLASGLITINDKYAINVYYNNDTIYLTYNDLYFKFNIKDIDKFGLNEIKLPEINIKLKDILDTIKTLNINMLSNNSFDLAIDLTKFTDLLKDVKLTVSKNDGLNFEVEKYNLLVNVKEASKEVEVNPDVEYNDLANISWLIDIVKDAIEKDAFSFDVNLKYNDLTVTGNIYLDKDLNVSAVVDVLYKDYEFKDITAYYINDAIYANIYNLKVKITVQELLSLIGNEKTLSLDIDKLLESFALSLTESSLGIDLEIDNIGNVSVLVNNEKEISINSDTINANVVLSYTDKKDIVINNDEYIDVKNIEWLIDLVKEAISYEAYNFSIDLTYEDLKVVGNVYLDKDLNIKATVSLTYKDYTIDNVNVYYIDNTIYVSLYNIKLSLTINDIVSLIGEMPKIDVIKLISNLTLKAVDNSVNMGLNLTEFNGLDMFGMVNVIASEDKVINLTTDLINANIKLMESSKQEININKDEFISLSSLEWLINDIKDVLNYEAYSFNISLEYKELKLNGALYLNKDLEIEAKLNINYSGLLLNDVTLMFKDNVIFVKYANTTIKLDINDIDDIIAEVNRIFGLNISMDNMNTKIDLDTLLKGITFNALDNKLVINANLNSISELLGNVVIEINSDLSVKVNNTDIKLEAALYNTSNKEVILPDASINKDELLLILEYASQLKDLVEKWRYNIGFELHVNGYDVYAIVNIVTFKPNKGLSLYGKVILVKGKAKYYVEASIIDNVAFLNFSQTITNFNSSNPIASTTSQSIKFKIDFNELIDTANYAIDALNIDNDSIKMAITYLGTIVNTDGDFDELFNDISDKVTSFDLSMLNDFIDLSKIGIFVDTDKLTIDFGINSLGDNHKIEIFREDGQIKGLNTINFEINNDILDSHFEMLPDENITSANYNGCLNLNGISNLIKAGLDNYNKGEIELNGSANLELIGIKLAGVTIKAKIDFDYEGKLRAEMYIKVPKVIIATNAETEDYIYIYNDMIYIKRVTQEGGFLGIGTKEVTATRKMSLSDFGKDALEQIIWIFNFGDTVANAIREAEAVDPKIEEVLKSYSKSNNTYSVTLDGEKLVGSNAFDDINLGLTVTTINNLYYLSNISINATIVSVIKVDANLTVNNGTISWSSFPSATTLNSYNAYTIYKKV